jgi:putative transposase
MRLAEAFEIFKMTRHQYYYNPKPLKRSRPGCPASTHTIFFGADGTIERHTNKEVVTRMKEIQTDDDLRCGYKRMSGQLQIEGYQINHKKVHRLMKKHQILLKKALKPIRPYVQHRIARAEEPLTLLEMDIKMVWIEEDRRHAYILTIIDTFTRHTLWWSMGFRMKWKDVRRAWTWVIINHLQPADILARKLNIEIRSDNGPQFLAKQLRKFFKDNDLNQVFTHPYTPQENGHIESFHSILSTAIQHEYFWTIDQLETRLVIFYEKYNNERVHSSIANLTPALFLKAWGKNLIAMKKNKKKCPTFILKVPRYKLSGNLKSEVVSRSADQRIDSVAKQKKGKKVNGAVTSNHRSNCQPSVASR